MEKYDIYATLDIHAVAEGTSPENALDSVIESKEYEIINVKLGNRTAEDYVSLSEFARIHDIGDGGIYLRKLCQQGKLPGAVKVGRNWCVPRNTPYGDRRVKSGKYIGVHPKYTRLRAEKENQTTSEETAKE